MPTNADEAKDTSKLARASYDVDSFALQGIYGYKMGDFSPEAGLRYINAKQDTYTDTTGQHVGSNSSDTLTAIFGGRYATLRKTIPIIPVSWKHATTSKPYYYIAPITAGFRNSSPEALLFYVFIPLPKIKSCYKLKQIQER